LLAIGDALANGLMRQSASLLIPALRGDSMKPAASRVLRSEAAIAPGRNLMGYPNRTSLIKPAGSTSVGGVIHARTGQLPSISSWSQTWLLERHCNAEGVCVNCQLLFRHAPRPASPGMASRPISAQQNRQREQRIARRAARGKRCKSSPESHTARWPRRHGGSARPVHKRNGSADALAACGQAVRTMWLIGDASPLGADVRGKTQGEDLGWRC
jgi:hypothetical protein